MELRQPTEAEERPTRRRWDGQKAWDKRHMCTESTRFTAKQDAELRRYCEEAGITRYALISYLLQAWMAEKAEEAAREARRQLMRPPFRR